MKPFDYYLGAEKTPSDQLLISIWRKIHDEANIWGQFNRLPSRYNSRGDIDVKTLKSLTELNGLSREKWMNLSSGIGMTVYGAIALSWCKGAELSQVWEGWEASGFPLKSLPEFERPARFINPTLLPKTNSLLELTTIAENKPLPICAMIVAKGDALEADLSPEMATKANPQIASFLKTHMERKSDRTAEQDQMIEVWTQKVSGTEWEV